MTTNERWTSLLKEPMSFVESIQNSLKTKNIISHDQNKINKYIKIIDWVPYYVRIVHNKTYEFIISVLKGVYSFTQNEAKKTLDRIGVPKFLDDIATDIISIGASALVGYIMWWAFKLFMLSILGIGISFGYSLLAYLAYRYLPDLLGEIFAHYYIDLFCHQSSNVEQELLQNIKEGKTISEEIISRSSSNLDIINQGGYLTMSMLWLIEPHFQDQSNDFTQKIIFNDRFSTQVRLI